MNHLVFSRPSQNPLVLVENGHVTTTSLIVAEAFGKQHRNVLQSIRNLECSDDFRRLNFQQSSYVNEQGKPQPLVHMTRDGAMMLIMGFTGAKAAAMREAFIAEFSRMEAELKQRTDRRAEKAEREALRLLRELRLRDRQVIAYARREARALQQRAQAAAAAPRPASDPRQQPLDLDLSDIPPLAGAPFAQEG